VASDSSPSIPRKRHEWAAYVFDDFFERIHKLDIVLKLSVGGITQAVSSPRMIELLNEFNRLTNKPWMTPEQLSEKVENARIGARLAQKEVKEGFSTLHSQALLMLWGSVEDLVKSLLAGFLENEESARNSAALQKVKVSIGEYESLDPKERYFYVLDLLERELQAPNKQGANRFETLLEAFSLSGPIADEVKQCLFEMYHMRNAIAHRRGVADRRLVVACTWLNLQVGMPVRISQETYARYLKVVETYASELLYRMADYYGISRAYLEGRSAAQPADTEQQSEQAT